jgi:hypothetical protein
MGREELIEDARQATILVVASEERTYINWKDVGVKWRKVYKNRDTMSADKQHLMGYVLLYALLYQCMISVVLYAA